MTPALWALWLELRHAKALPGSVLTVPIGLFVGHGALWSGTYIWENRTYALVVSLTLVGPVLAAFAAWDGSRLRSAGLGIQWRLARDRGSRAVLALLVSNLVLGALVYATIGVGLFLPLGVPGVPSGGPIWAWVASSTVGLFAMIAFGLLVGMAIPFLLTVPVVAIAVYVANALILILGPAIAPNVAVLTFAYQQLMEPFFTVNETLFAQQGIWYLCVLFAVTALAVTVASRRGIVSWLFVIAGIAAAVVSGSFVAHSANGATIYTQSAPFSCRGTAPSLCLTPAYEPLRPSIAKALGPMERRLSGTALAFDTVELRPRGVEGAASPGAVALHMDNQAAGWQQRDTEEMLLERLNEENPAGLCFGSPVSDPAEKAFGNNLVVISWAIGNPARLALFPELQPALAALTGMSPADRIEWIAAQLPAMCAGTLDLRTLE